MIRSMVFGFVLMLATSSQAQNTTIEDTISQQLQAFNERDIEGAWQFASPTIQGIFRTPDNFARMVQNGYPMVWDNSDARFLDQQQVGSGVRQEVLIRGPDEAFYILDYLMIETPSGWLINSVQVIPAPDNLS